MRFFSLLAALILSAGCIFYAQETPENRQLAHFHHVHLNATDPQVDQSFYPVKFDCEKATYGGNPAVWAQKSWLLFDKVNTPPKSEITSTIWHIGWGAENMIETYRKQLDMGTKFETPLTDISDIGGAPRPLGSFFYAYVDGPDHQLIELNTANHHHFGHVHMLSKDPIGAGEWYVKEFGLRRLGPATQSREPRMYRGLQIGPSSSLMMDNVNIIIFPMEYAKGQWPELWKDRNDFESTKGHVSDHLGFGVDNLDQTLARLKNDGVKITDPPSTIPGTKVRNAFIEGPDHIRIELVEEQPHIG